MVDNKNVEEGTDKVSARDLLKEMREFAITVGEECPEGHRRDPSSGRCLPIGSTDHTAFTRSLNDDQGDEWRGLVDKDNETFDNEENVADRESASNTEKAVDADLMDEPESCAHGTTFSFVQRKCVSPEEAEAENNDDKAMTASDEYILEDAKNGHEEVVSKDPRGRRDPVGFDCPPNQFFDFKRRECIPLNKDTVMASIASGGLKEEAFHGVAWTSPDPVDGHRHAVTVDMEGSGRTSVAVGGIMERYPHSHDVEDFEVIPHEEGDYTSRHPGGVNPMADTYEMEAMPLVGSESKLMTDAEYAADEKEAKRSDLPDDAFGVPEDRKFPLDTCDRVRNAMARFNQAKGLSASDKKDLKRNILERALECKIDVEEFKNVGPDVGEETIRKIEKKVNGSSEEGKKLSTKKRKGLPASAFGVPGKRKFPLDTCNRVRNAMARFNQAKGLTSSEKATLRRKIMARAKSCGIKVDEFAKATTAEDFEKVFAQLIVPFQREKAKRLDAYHADKAKDKKGPCPPGMEWDPKTKRCIKMKAFYDKVVDKASHQEIISKDPAGRRDTEGFQCPDGWFFDFKNRKCIPLDPEEKRNFQPGDTTKAAEEDAAKRDLAPSPKGKPARLPQDCPKGTIWDPRLRKCRPLDPPDGAQPPRGKASDDEGSTNPNGPGKEKDTKGCLPFQVWNPKTQKCETRKKQFKGKSDSEKAVNAQPSNREGLVGAPAGKVKHATDCPPGTIWDGKNRLCRPLDSMDKSRPDGNSPQNPQNFATVEDVVENMSLAKLIAHLDQIIREEVQDTRKEKAKVAAKDLPNEAFPPSLVGSTRRSLMHHSPDVTDPYDTGTVDVARLRNALARVNKISGYSERAVDEAYDHLLFHAREVVAQHLGKK
ncbi:MAG: hypothetical protein GF334_01545 [Candidatus Altiarchaeales archaeon]|nr:hypothetical protein [Candidatus Altiarchaeales archaeon]